MGAPATMKRREGPKAPPSPDYQEVEALNRAEAALNYFSPGLPKPRALAEVAISAWIIARTSMAASVRLSADLVFDLKDARMRGFLEAALPQIGAALAHLPADIALFDLSKDQILDVFSAAIAGAREAAVSANESLGFPFDDEIPY